MNSVFFSTPHFSNYWFLAGAQGGSQDLFSPPPGHWAEIPSTSDEVGPSSSSPMVRAGSRLPVLLPSLPCSRPSSVHIGKIGIGAVPARPVRSFAS